MATALAVIRIIDELNRADRHHRDLPGSLRLAAQRLQRPLPLFDGRPLVARAVCLAAASSAASSASTGDNSNTLSEAQWYMFAGMVMLGGAWTLKLNEHVRVDLIYGSVRERTRTWIDLLGLIFFLLPMCVLMIWFTWPWFYQSWLTNEGSLNAGGLDALAGEADRC